MNRVTPVWPFSILFMGIGFLVMTLKSCCKIVDCLWICNLWFVSVTDKCAKCCLVKCKGLDLHIWVSCIMTQCCSPIFRYCTSRILRIELAEDGGIVCDL